MKIKDFEIGKDNKLTIIAGPCVLESLKHSLFLAEKLKSICDKNKVNFIFKGSFDKANRSSINSPRGLGIYDGLKVLKGVKEALNVPVTTDIHEPWQAIDVGKIVDLVQIPAFLCRQTDLLIEAAGTGKPVNVKKGQFMSAQDMLNVVNKLEESNSKEIMLTERGTFFGYNRLVNDFTAVQDMINFNYPVCFDITHSTQQPGGNGKTSGGNPEYSPMLAKAAVAIGVPCLFMEVHDDPKNALCDSSTVLDLKVVEKLICNLAKLRLLVCDSLR